MTGQYELAHAEIGYEHSSLLFISRAIILWHVRVVEIFMYLLLMFRPYVGMDLILG